MVDGSELAALVLRVVVGTIFVAEAQRKLFGAPDARHGRADLRRLVARAGAPAPALVASLVSWLELVCGALVLVGLFTRLATVPLAAILLVAIVRIKWSDGFIGGWDWPLSVLAATVGIALLGPGAVSLDAAIGASR